MKKLLFIYNANSRKTSGFLDTLHKAVGPKTYNCNLCGITYGFFNENKTWKKFREASDIPMEFLHLDEFRKQYASKFGYKFTFPIVLSASQNDLEIVVSTEELNRLKNADELVQIITNRQKEI
jgi:hypothetical protein